ncbi:MAG: ribosomal-processing cysteine protease Prp, partial [Acutalibacteraceae bacterium]
MIRASFEKSRATGFFTGFTVKGHAGYSEEGSDIVCAAVSSAVYM